MDQISIRDILECVGENINPAKDILGSEAESASTVEYHLSKNYFTNLGVIMREYLTTTTLGDLQRKSKEITLPEETINTQETAAPTSTFNQSADASPFSSMIRGQIGEINQ